MATIYIAAPNIYYTYELPAVPGAEIYVGTSPQCQLSLPGVEGLGEVHASISCQPQGYLITDYGTPYGLLANGVAIKADYLRPGVEYRLGTAVITLAAESAVAPALQQPVAAAPAAAPAAAGAAAPKKAATLKKKASPLKTGAAAPGKGKAVSAATASQFKRKGDSALFNLIYVIVLITAAVYAGIALHHWQKTNNYLPGIMDDPPTATSTATSDK